MVNHSLFGTQFTDRSGKFEAWPVEDPEGSTGGEHLLGWGRSLKTATA